MSAQPAPLTHKLILLALVVIAACLGMITVRIYAPSPEQANVASAIPSGDVRAQAIRQRWASSQANGSTSNPRGLSAPGSSAADSEAGRGDHAFFRSNALGRRSARNERQGAKTQRRKGVDRKS